MSEPLIHIADLRDWIRGRLHALDVYDEDEMAPAALYMLDDPTAPFGARRVTVREARENLRRALIMVTVDMRQMGFDDE